jgi:hypothetical protein
MLQQAGQLSRESAVKAFAADFDIADIDEELARIENETKDAQ